MTPTEMIDPAAFRPSKMKGALEEIDEVPQPANTDRGCTHRVL